MRNRFDLLAARGRLLELALTVGTLAAPAAHAATMTVALNHSARLTLSGPAASVVVGNPAVADVTVVDSRTVFVSGRGAGSTDVAVLDPLGRTLFSGDVHVSTQAGAHVTVHRGPSAVSDMACDPTCVAVAPAAGGAAKPGAVMAGALLGAMGAALAGSTSESVSNAAQTVPAASTAALLGHS